MSQKPFSNTEVPSDKTADPYTATNKSEPELKEKVRDLVSFIESCKFGMMTTRIGSSGLLTSRCMALAAKEGGGVDLLFHTNTESGKTDDLKSDPKINIAFLNSTGEWASVSGEADIVTDREVVRKYYSPALKAWLGDLEDGKHDGGPEDPRIGVIKVKAVTATYAIATGTSFGRGADILKGAITGSSPKVNKLRELTEQELQQFSISPTTPIHHSSSNSKLQSQIQQQRHEPHHHNVFLSPTDSKLDLIDSMNPDGQLTKLISDGRFTSQASAWLIGHTKKILEWFRQSHVRKMLLASGITFGTVILVIGSLGFGTAGIAGGSIAATLQSILYGGLTPAGGLFATLQSMGMLGTLLPAGVGIGAVAAAVVSVVMWLRSGGEGEVEEEHERLE